MDNVKDLYVNYWGIKKPQFTDMQLALMEGGHALEEPKFQFLASLKEDRGARRDIAQAREAAAVKRDSKR